MEKERKGPRSQEWAAANREEELGPATPPRWRMHELAGGFEFFDERRATPAHSSLFEREVARAKEAAPCSPAVALHYASWLLSSERGWASSEIEDQVARERTRKRQQLRGLPHRSEPAVQIAARGLSEPDGSLDEAEREERLEGVLARVEACGAGVALAAELAARMQAELEHSFTHVRVHDDEAAAAACELLGAQAFTLGHHIYFGAGQLAPGSEEGERLLRHELTHVIQHDRGALVAGSRAEVLSPSSGAEAEARAAEAPRPAKRRAMPDWAGGSTEAEPTPTPAPAPAPAPALAAKATPAATPAAAKQAMAALDTVVSLQGTFAPPADVAAHLEKAGEAGAGVRVSLPGVTQTAVIQVKKVKGRYVTVEEQPQLVPLTHALFAYAGKLAPVLRIRIGHGQRNAVTGYVATAATAADSGALQKLLAADLSPLGLRGFTLPKLSLTNSLGNGVLAFGLGSDVAFSIGGWVDGRLTLSLRNEQLSFAAKAEIHARGLQRSELSFSRDDKGAITGFASLGLALGDNFTGEVNATYKDGDISVRGELGYHSEKLSGKLSVMLADADEAEAMVRAELPPDSVLPAAPGSGDTKASKPGKPGKNQRGIAGTGTLDFAFSDWLTGAAKVVYGPSGYLTVIGKIAPPKQLDLMKTPRQVHVPILPEKRFEASYGLPYIADVHLGISISLGANAGLGPIYMTDLAVDGLYSTDPSVLNKFAVTGTLHAQADADVSLAVKGYAGLRLLGHSVRFGAEIVGKAGVQAYAEARTTIGYREKAAPTAGKQGEYYLQGNLAMAARPILSLGGDLFVELDSPWWSPAPSKIWRWPVFLMEYPIDAQLGVGADIDHVLGSGQWPDVTLTKPSFDPSKFVDSMMDRKLPARTVRPAVQKEQGTWRGAPPAKPTESKPAAKPSPKPAAEAKASTAGPSGASGKPAKGNQTEAEKKAVPATSEIARRWNAGMEALGKLRLLAEKDPETKEEIDKHLAEIKAKHGFTKLSPTLAGKVWRVEAAMNPTSEDVAKKELFEIKAEKEVPLADEVKKAESPRKGFYFRGDDEWREGDSVGVEITAGTPLPEAEALISHVHPNAKEEKKRTRRGGGEEEEVGAEGGLIKNFVSFSEILGKGSNGAAKFTSKNKISKVAVEALDKLAAEGVIRILRPEDVAAIIAAHPRKKVAREANNVKKTMENNHEILIQGQIPGTLLVKAT